MKAKKGKAGIERACSAEPSPGQIKVKKKKLGGRIERKGKKDEGRLSLLADGWAQRKMVRRTTGCPEQIVHMAPRSSVYAPGVM